MISFKDLNFYHISKSDSYDEDIWYHDDYINADEHTEINDFHKVLEIITETELKTFNNSDEQFTAQFRLADLLIKLCICKECH